MSKRLKKDRKKAQRLDKRSTNSSVKEDDLLSIDGLLDIDSPEPKSRVPEEVSLFTGSGKLLKYKNHAKNISVQTENPPISSERKRRKDRQI
jgi:hypothetical protein